MLCLISEVNPVFCLERNKTKEQNTRADLLNQAKNLISQHPEGAWQHMEAPGPDQPAANCTSEVLKQSRHFWIIFSHINLFKKFFKAMPLTFPVFCLEAF